MTLWSKRFTQPMDPLAWAMNSSLAIDQRLAKHDVQGSIAWVKALLKAGLFTLEESDNLVLNLELISNEFESGDFQYQQSDEDIHTAVERRLGELTGPLAGKLHTGRSRNDQVATDLRLWMMQTLPALDGEIVKLQSALDSQGGTERPYNHARIYSFTKSTAYFAGALAVILFLDVAKGP